MNTALLGKIATRANDPTTRIDEAHGRPPDLAPALSDADLAKSIDRLGFQPHADVVAVFRHVGNGGFGPGYGISGLSGGATDDQGQTAVDLYCLFAKSDPDTPAWSWPKGLLPLCHWGCAMYTCVDCNDAQGALVHWEPNVLSEDDGPDAGLFPMKMTFEEWIGLWATGGDIWAHVEATMSG